MNGAIGHITEIIWSLFHSGQLHYYFFPSVRKDFGKDGTHVINPISKQFVVRYVMELSGKEH